MLNWNAAKLKNLTPTEIWCFIVARVFIGFGFGVLVTQRYPQTAGVLALPVLIYSAVKVRRFALATTSESGAEIDREPATALAAAPLRCGSLRSPSLRSVPAKAPEERTPREMPLISSFFFLALLIN